MPGSGRDSHAIGLLELKQVAQGIRAIDVVCKASDVTIVSAGPVCPGKYLLIFRGDVSSVSSAIDRALAGTEGLVYDYFWTGALHPDVFPAVCGMGTSPALGESLGIVETFSAASAISAADAAVKSADVKLVDVRLSRGLGGRAYALMAGSIGAVQTAVEAGGRIAADEGVLVDSVIVANPHPSLLEALR